MLTHRLRQLTASILCTASLCAPVSAVFAQDDATAQEALELYVGDIFEILPVHPLTDATYTWILTQDRNFIEAGRAQTFRKRLITPGRYTLYAEISSADQSKHFTRSFILDYKPRTPGLPVLPEVSSGSTTATSLVRTVPAQDSNMRVIVPTQSQLVKLDPINPDVRPIVADLDLGRDTDGDSNPTNDIDTELTFFQTDATPLYVWLTEPLTTRTLAVTAAMPDGALVQTIEVAGEAYAQEQGLVQSPVDVEVKQAKGRSFSFSAAFEIPAAPQAPLLYHWEFGDGQQSLLATPVHEYAADGTYEVKLRIRNLTDGKDVATFTQEVEVVEKMDGEVITPDPEPTDPEPDETPATGSSMSIGSILLMAGIFIASILFGLLAIFVLSKLRRKGTSISDTIEAMEQSIVKTDSASKAPTLSIAPAPSATKQTTLPPPEVAKREEERESETPAVLPKEDAKAPSWLKSAANTQPAVAPEPKPQTPTPTPAVTPAPKPQPTPTAPQAKPVSTPPWLQTPAAPAATPAQPKPAAPAPATTPVVPQQPKPVTPPAPQASKPAGTPPWLQTPPKPATPAATPQQPKQAPVVPTPTPAPATPVQPKPVTPPAPQATPVVQTPMPVTPPVVQPPVNQVVPPVPKPAVPVAPATPAPAVTPPAPKPFVPPTPAPTPVPAAPAPTRVAPPVQPKPVTPAQVAPAPMVATPVQPVFTPAPVIAPKPVTPPVTPAPAAPIDQNDEPIAIIRADSLGTAQPVQPRPDTPTPPAAA